MRFALRGVLFAAADSFAVAYAVREPSILSIGIAVACVSASAYALITDLDPLELR